MSFKITVLGSNSALPTSNGFPSAHVVNIHEHFFLVDCGEGTQIQLRKHKFNFNRIDSIFISHLHGDHFFGIFGLISTLSLLGRLKDLHIYSHENLKNIIFSVIDFHTINYKIIFHNLNYNNSEIIFENKSISIKSFPLKHRIETCGFLFSEKEKLKKIKKESIQKYQLGVIDILKIKAGMDFCNENGEIIPNSELTEMPVKPCSYAYCSDTEYFEPIAEEIKNVDLLYHEATFEASGKDLAKKTGHSTTIDAATIAKKAEAGKLIIGHFSTRYKNYDKLVAEARTIFPETYHANTDSVFEI
jgi:ribonuclease Z